MAGYSELVVSDSEIVRTYIGHAAFEHGAQQLRQRGWRVVRVYEQRRRIGTIRFLLLRQLAWLFPPEPRLIVTYRRHASRRSE